MVAAGDTSAGLRVVLRKERRGPVIASADVLPHDLAEPLAELGFAAGLRRGFPQLALSELKARLRPVHRTTDRTGRSCSGFTLEAETPPGEITRCSFDREVFASVAARLSRELSEAGVLAAGDLYFYELELDPGEAEVGPLEIEGVVAPPVPEHAPLAPLLARARAVRHDREQGLADEAYARDPRGAAAGPTLHGAGREPTRPGDGLGSEVLDDSSHFAVFYTRRALDKAERVSRAGAAAVPAVETGGLLVGRLCWCPESRSLFGVIEDVLEASHSEATTYSLTFTGETWGRLQAVLRARRSQPATRNQRLLGQCHGHSFLPYDEGATCDGCPSQGSCRLSTAYLSEDDRRWCRAVFPREPWQLSHVFGLTPRREPIDAFYGQRGAVLERRGYYVIDDLHAER
jgi:hypothetical protein